MKFSRNSSLGEQLRSIALYGEFILDVDEAAALLFEAGEYAPLQTGQLARFIGDWVSTDIQDWVFTSPRKYRLIVPHAILSRSDQRTIRERLMRVVDDFALGKYREQ